MLLFSSDKKSLAVLRVAMEPPINRADSLPHSSSSSSSCSVRRFESFSNWAESAQAAEFFLRYFARFLGAFLHIAGFCLVKPAYVLSYR